MYTVFNYKTKKALKAAVKEGERPKVMTRGDVSPAVFDGEAYIEGPHHPERMSWSATVKVENGKIVKVLS